MPPGASPIPTSAGPSRLADSVIRVYAQATDELLVNIAKRFDANDPEAGSADWQFKKLAELGQLRKENLDIIAKKVGGCQPLVAEALKKSALNAIADVEPSLRSAAEKGILAAADFTPEASPRIQAMLQAYQRQAFSELNLVNTTMLNSSVQAYITGVTNVQMSVAMAGTAQTVLNTETGEAILGAKTRVSAVRSAIKQMAKSGITGFTDKAGRNWTPEAYAGMVIHTTMHNTFRQAVFDRNQDYDNDLVYAPAKAMSREGCYPWQNVIMSTNNNPRTVTDFNGNEIKVIGINESSYGQPAGIWGVNCRHNCNIFIPGVSTVREDIPPKEQSDEQYQLSQQQRQLERDVRAAKRRVAMADASGDKEEFSKAAAKLKESRLRLSDFNSKHGQFGVPNTDVLGYKNMKR